ncbi:ATP-dependent DNA helicase HFM1, partial [Asbolus verrucosus]
FESEDLRPIEEIPHPYQQVFAQFAGFNIIQSKILDDVLYTDNSLVVSAPTGSGKTAIFELAIIRLLIAFEKTEFANLFKIIYISPMKALCEERLVDWHKKFANFGINCISVTGDSDNVEFQNLFNHNLIITTPEKWDCLTRKWKDNKKLVQVIKLFMIDEVHLINEECRGSTLETIVCRMKTIEESVKCEQETDDDLNHKIRFVAVSATITNIEDIAEWIGKSSNAKYYKPVKLTKIVLGYPYGPHSTPFKFDLALNYKLQSLMMQYSHGKPTLIFCSTRKMVEMTAKHLLQHLTINLKPEQKQHLVEAAGTISDAKVKETLVHGVGYHHAGMLSETKRAIENLFRNSQLPVLVTTSTLAVGVNLPAHLVIIKSTKCYTSGEFRDYTETALMQMIGRAGRPQFDATATALILTTEKDRQKFEKMIGGLEPIESNLHRHLTEHLNAEMTGGEILQQILNLISKCHEFSEMFLRVNDKKCLNLLNKCRNRQTIRFPLSGKIKTVDMKINCIIQAVLGCLDICDHSILSETLKIMRNGERILLNKKPPVGGKILEQIQYLPKYKLKLEVSNKKSLTLIVSLENAVDLQERSTVNRNSFMHLLVGDSSNNILLYEKYSHSYMIEHPDVVKFIDIKQKNVEDVEAHFISEDWVGIDCTIKLVPKQDDYDNRAKITKQVNNKQKSGNNKLSDEGVTYMQKFMEMYMKCKTSLKQPSNGEIIKPVEIRKFKFAPKKLPHKRTQSEISWDSSLKDFGYLDAEQIRDKKPKNQNKISWRSPLTYSPPVKFSPKIDYIRRDQDFADSSIDEGYESRNKIMDDLHDFISPSLWENVGLINQKKNSLNQVKSPTSAEYYSQLLSQSQLKNDPEQKKEEIFSS